MPARMSVYANTTPHAIVIDSFTYIGEPGRHVIHAN